jgi:hypothetical protein
MYPLIRHCLHCGMSMSVTALHIDMLPPALLCHKCDQNVYQQHDGSCLTRDIAHNHETIKQALQKLDTILLECWQAYCQSLRLIVGGGVIREHILGQLHYYQQQHRLISFKEESPNRGAIVVRLRAA